MSDWLHNLPVVWIALIIIGGTYLVAGTIYAVVRALAKGEGARTFKAVSPSIIPPLGILFGLFVVAAASQVWGDTDRARGAVSREATALSSVLFLANSFPGEPEQQMRALIHTYIEETATREWSEIARRAAPLRITPQPLAAALRLALSLTPANHGQETAQLEIVSALESALNARQERIITSRSQVNPLMWSCLVLQGISLLIAIAMVHVDNRHAAVITLGLFATGIAALVLVILAYDRPFAGKISIRPDPLLHVLPEIETSQK